MLEWRRNPIKKEENESDEMFYMRQFKGTYTKYIVCTAPGVNIV